MTPNTQAQSAASQPASETVDRWIESLQILAGPDDNPTPGQRAEMGVVRSKMLAALKAAHLDEAIAVARHEYLADDTRTPEDAAYNQGVTDVIAAIGALLESGK